MSYIIDQVKALQLLKKSQKLGGHPFSRHIGITNQELLKRLHGPDKSRKDEIAWISAFKTEWDAAKAASQAFKNLDSPIAAAIKIKKHDIRTDQAFRVRLAFADRVREVETDLVTLVLAASESQEGEGFFIETFYPRPPEMIGPLTGLK